MHFVTFQYLPSGLIKQVLTHECVRKCSMRHTDKPQCDIFLLRCRTQLEINIHNITPLLLYLCVYSLIEGGLGGWVNDFLPAKGR